MAERCLNCGAESPVPVDHCNQCPAVQVYVRQAAAAEREQCCKDMCHHCNTGDVPERNAAGQWKHGGIFCAAGAIRARAAKEAKREGT